MEHIVHGVVFQIYPLARKRQPRTLICYHVGRAWRRDTFKGDLAAAQKRCRVLAREVASGDAADDYRPSAMERRVILAAQHICARLGQPLDVVCRQYAEAVALLGPGATLAEAARAWRKRQASRLPEAPVAQVVQELLRHLESKRRAPSTIKSLQIPLAKLAAALALPIADVTSADLERWLATHAATRAPRTLNNWIHAMQRLFNYARGRYLPKNEPTAAAALEEITDARGAVTIFAPWELQLLLQHASPALRPFIALAAFAGLRTIELHRIEWSAIHLEAAAKYPHGYIEVPGHAAKQHRNAGRRLVPLPPNLVTWLRQTPAEALRHPRHGRLSHYSEDRQISRTISGLIKRINRARQALNLPLISPLQNRLRHSYGSYRLPVLGNADLLAGEMNNSRQEIIRDYHELVHPDRVPEYWSIARHETPPAPLIALPAQKIA